MLRRFRSSWSFTSHAPLPRLSVTCSIPAGLPPFCWSCYKPIWGTLIRSDVWYLWGSEWHPAGGKVVEGTRSTSPASLAGALLPCSREAPQVLATAPWTDAHYPPPPTLCPLNGPLHFSVTHGFTWKHWTAITCLFRVNEFCRFLFMDLLFLLGCILETGLFLYQRVWFKKNKQKNLHIFCLFFLTILGNIVTCSVALKHG